MWIAIVIGSLVSFSATARDLDHCRSIVLQNILSVGDVKGARCVSEANSFDVIDLKPQS